MKTKLSIFILLLNFLSCSSQSETNSNAINEYHLEFGGINERQVTVNANIYVDGDELEMIQRPERFFPDINSWWDIITINKIEDKSGSPVRIIKFEGNKAKFDRKIKGILNIKYIVDISYIDREYPNHNTAIGKSFKEGLFIVGKPLFVFGDWKLNTLVTVDNPKGIKVTVPWDIVDQKYSAPSLRELVLSNVIISSDTIGVVDFSVGKLSYSLATFGLDDDSIKMVKQIADDISSYYVKTFPFDHDIRYVQLVYGVPSQNGGGEAYPFSSASAISKYNLKDSFLWKITVFHELFHMWNSHMLKGVSRNSEMEWFQEGFTDYMTELALLKTGHIDSETLIKFQNNSLKPLEQRLENNPENISIKSSGSNKGENYVIVYRGGWFIANWLEKELKQVSNSKWNIERLFNNLLENYPQEGSKNLTVEAFIETIATIDTRLSKELKEILNSTDWSILNNKRF